MFGGIVVVVQQMTAISSFLSSNGRPTATIICCVILLPASSVRSSLSAMRPRFPVPTAAVFSNRSVHVRYIPSRLLPILPSLQRLLQQRLLWRRISRTSSALGAIFYDRLFIVHFLSIRRRFDHRHWQRNAQILIFAWPMQWYTSHRLRPYPRYFQSIIKIDFLPFTDIFDHCFRQHSGQISQDNRR